MDLGGSVQRLKCGHGFHSKCIGIWLAARSGCPVCREEIVRGPQSQTGPSDIKCNHCITMPDPALAIFEDDYIPVLAVGCQHAHYRKCYRTYLSQDITDGADFVGEMDSRRHSLALALTEPKCRLCRDETEENRENAKVDIGPQENGRVPEYIQMGETGGQRGEDEPDLRQEDEGTREEAEEAQRGIRREAEERAEDSRRDREARRRQNRQRSPLMRERERRRSGPDPGREGERYGGRREERRRQDLVNDRRGDGARRADRGERERERRREEQRRESRSGERSGDRRESRGVRVRFDNYRVRQYSHSDGQTRGYRVPGQHRS